MRKWEYRMEFTDYLDHSEKIALLNKLGSEGWELAAVSVGLFYLKREIVVISTTFTNGGPIYVHVLDPEKDNRETFFTCGGV